MIEFPGEWLSTDGGTAVFEAKGHSEHEALRLALAWAEAQDPERHLVVPPASPVLRGIHRLTVYELKGPA